MKAMQIEKKLINDGIAKGFCDWYDEIKYAQKEDYGVSTEQLKAINYAIKIFKASSDLELLRIEAEHMALAFEEDSKIMYDKLTNTLRHVNRDDIIISMVCT